MNTQALTQSPQRNRRRALFLALALPVAFGLWVTWLWCFDSAPPDDAHLLPPKLAPITSEENAYAAFLRLRTGDVGRDQGELRGVWNEWYVNRLAQRPTYFYDDDSAQERLIEEVYEFDDLKERFSNGAADLEKLMQQLELLVALPHWHWSAPEEPSLDPKFRRVATLLRLQLCLCAERHDVAGMIRVLDVVSRLMVLQAKDHPLAGLVMGSSMVFSEVDLLLVAAESNASQLAQVQALAVYGVDYRARRALSLRFSYSQIRRGIHDEKRVREFREFAQLGRVKPDRTISLLARDIELLLKLPFDTWREHQEQLTRLLPSEIQSSFQSVTGNKGGHQFLELWHEGFATNDLRLFTARCDAVLCATSLALLRFEQERGALPQRLAELVPRYLAKLPVDVFDGQPLRYWPEGRWVYSVGENLNDQAGDPNAGDDLWHALPVQPAKLIGKPAKQ